MTLQPANEIPRKATAVMIRITARAALHVNPVAISKMAGITNPTKHQHRRTSGRGEIKQNS